MYYGLLPEIKLSYLILIHKHIDGPQPEAPILTALHQNYVTLFS